MGSILKIILILLSPIVSANGFLGTNNLGNISYLNARYLSHTTSRFLTQDTKKQFKSKYAYGNGRVISYSDPSGNVFGKISQALDMIFGVKSESAINALVSEETTMLYPDGGYIDTHLRVHHSNGVIVSMEDQAELDYHSVLTDPPNYYSTIDRMPPSYSSIFPDGHVPEEPILEESTVTHINLVDMDRSIVLDMHGDIIDRRHLRLLNDYERGEGMFAIDYLDEEDIPSETPAPHRNNTVLARPGILSRDSEPYTPPVEGVSELSDHDNFLNSWYNWVSNRSEYNESDSD